MTTESGKEANPGAATSRVDDLELDTCHDMELNDAVKFLRTKNIDLICASLILYHKINLEIIVVQTK